MHTAGPGSDLARLHVIVDPLVDRADGLVAAVACAGAPLIQLRATRPVADADLLAAITPLVGLAREHGTRVVVNDRADLAVAACADGVHGGAEDLPVSALRRVVGADRLVGGTARNPEMARHLVADGADYLGVGPVYATSSKRGLPAPIGLDMLAQVVEAVSVPVIAIAGITPERIPAVLATGAHGVAVISAVVHAPDPAAVTTEMLVALGIEPAAPRPIIQGEP